MFKTTVRPFPFRRGFFLACFRPAVKSAVRSLLLGILVFSHSHHALAQEKGMKPAEITSLFRDEISQAGQKMHWRGERLSDDTAYALAMTGISWEIAWGKEHPFSLAWGDFSKAPRLNGQSGKNDIESIADVRRAYERRDYRRVVDTAASHFTLEQIGCETTLKESVGRSLMALGQPEQAFPVFAAPFDAGPDLGSSAALNRRFREAALEAAGRAGLKREMVAFSISLLLEPGEEMAEVDAARMHTLEKMGVDVDRLTLGILQSPERLRGLPAYAYAASDLLAWRASPRLVPFLLRLAQSDDSYLRSRAILGLGIAAYQPRPSDPANWSQRLLAVPLQEMSVSSSQRKMLDKEIHEALASDHIRIRVAGIIALALSGDAQSVPVLERLSRDRTYLLSAPRGEHDRTRRIFFPVRAAAAGGLARFGAEAAAAGGGEFSGRDLDREKRGGKDVTNDKRNLRKEVVSQLKLSPLDTPVPLAPEVSPSSRRDR